jgi:galactose mutarotase-like enzyme
VDGRRGDGYGPADHAGDADIPPETLPMSTQTEADPDRHDMAAGGLRAAMLAQGAELCSFRDDTGRELVWQAGPAWPRHAPNLFPIVGRLAGDRLRLGDASTRMTQHGFARDRRFAWESRTQDACRLVLRDDAATREIYPFAFRLDVGCALGADGLSVTYTVANPGEVDLPFSIGAHPAFAWPLRPGEAKDAHRLEFAEPEPAPIRRLRDGLLLAEPQPSPVQGRMLALDESLFANDAIVMDRVASRSLRYLGPDGTGIEVSWHGFRELGIWMRLGGEFLCIEPWAGHASPVGFDGDFFDKPGVVRLPPGATRSFGFRVQPVGRK